MLGKLDWYILLGIQLGVCWMWCSLNEFFFCYLFNLMVFEFVEELIISLVGFENGIEWEFRIYFYVNIGK